MFPATVSACLLRSFARAADLLLESLSTVQRLDLSLGSDERLLVVILLVGAPEDALGARRVDGLLLQRRVVRIVKAGSWHLELGGVPSLKRTDQLLFNHVDLLLTLGELKLVVLQVGEVVAVDFLQVLHFAKQDKLLLVDDFFDLLLEHVILPELFLPLTNLALFFFAIEALLESINLTLVHVQRVRDFFDLGALVLDYVPVITDASFES